MLNVSHLTKKYGNNLAVDDLSMTLESGQVYGFLGPNGAGKSTTLNMITGYLGATDGFVEVNGFRMDQETEKAKAFIGYLPEKPPLYEEMTAREYLEFAYDLKGFAKDIKDKKELAQAKKNAVDEAIASCRLESVEARLIRNLSKGFKQRVGVAQAILGKPEIIILDEPTVGLDPAQLKDIRELIRSLGQEHTVIFSSHILSEVSAVCDHVFIISGGKLVASESVNNLSMAFNKSQVMSLTVKGTEEVTEKLSGISGISSISCSAIDEETVSVKLAFEGDEDRRQEVIRYCVYNDVALLEITASRSSLEDIFLNLTEHNTEEEGEN